MKELQWLLDEKFHQYNSPDFIYTDPVSIPHRFSGKENIEISGFLTATIAWGQRSTIIRNAGKLMTLLGNDPYEFTLNATESEMQQLNPFVHRTFSGIDLRFFITGIRHLYLQYGGLQKLIADEFQQTGNLKYCLAKLHRTFFEIPHPTRTEKHLANVDNGASAKRLNMFLRWMVRKDAAGIDFGLWTEIPTSALYIPLDVHTGKVARALGLLTRKQNDWKAVQELTANLLKFDPLDPVKYDYALFGMGVFER